MLDDQIFVEKFGMLVDHLIGVQGYRLNDSFSDSYNSLYGSLRYYGLARPEPKRLAFNHAQCHDDDKDYQMTEDQALLCPARIRGFCFTSKVCAAFLVDNVDLIDFDCNAFHHLRIQPQLKNTIQALVEAHDPSASDFRDLVAGKGKGVVISLEGPPGSGKTLTAGKCVTSVLHT